MCFNALYELDPPSKLGVTPAWILAMGWCFVGLLIMTSLTAAFAPVLVTPITRPRDFGPAFGTTESSSVQCLRPSSPPIHTASLT